MGLLAKTKTPASADKHRLVVLVEFDTYAKQDQLEAATREVLRNIRLSMNKDARAFKPVDRNADRDPTVPVEVRYGSMWEEVQAAE